MSVKEKLENDLKSAMRARDELRKTTLRMALSEIKLAEKKKHELLDDPELLVILQREVKSRREAIADARKADRPDLITLAEAEIEILSVYLPQGFSTDELERIIKETIEEVGATSMSDMGKVMTTVMPKVRGRADGGDVNRLVRAILSQS
jgi:uncharacterized protein YqeY